MNSMQLFINGLGSGAFYGSIAVGFSLVWGVLNIVNMVHGSLVVLGAFLGFYFWKHTGLSPIISVPIVAAVTFAIGAAIQSIFVNKVISAPVLTTLTLTFGIDLILYNIMTQSFTATIRTVTVRYGNVDIGVASVPIDRLYVAVFALLITGLLYLVLRTSAIGRAIVAVRMDKTAAALMGIRVKTVYAITFGIGAMMAGMAGAVSTLVYPVTTELSAAYLTKAFAVCVIGGLGSVPGALLGGLVLGLIESFAGFAVGPQNAMILGLLVMLGVLLVRPAGLMGVKGFQ
jgi:branched-chain amino acid transport system permease protein